MAILTLTSDTLIGTAATGNIEYNGQFFGTDSAASRAQIQRITQGTAVASTSGTSINFTSIPAWVKRVTCILSSVQVSGSSTILMQLGTSGGVVTSGYTNTAGSINTTNNTTRGATSTSGILTYGGGSASLYVFSGSIVFVSLGSNIWTASGTTNNSYNNDSTTTAGQVSLGGTLDRVRFFTTNGTDTFTAGTVNILYEG
jgi:hypothetical protein